jgi:hypothetical protein
MQKLMDFLLVVTLCLQAIASAGLVFAVIYRIFLY